LIRSAGFFPLASVYWVLLPLLVRARIAGGPETRRRFAAARAVPQRSR
jgi:hypothetical protein